MAGREILAMILEHFRTPGIRETLFTMEHLIKLGYPGDNQMDVFFNRWVEITSNMAPADTPPDDWLKTTLYKKIRSSNVLMFDIKQFESWDDHDQRKNYRYLLNIMARAIARKTEDRNAAERERYARDFASTSRPAGPSKLKKSGKEGDENKPAAPSKPEKKGKPGNDTGGKRKDGNPTIPILPHPSSKNHGKAKGKGKGKRDATRSPSPSAADKKKIPCHFHFVRKTCKKGKDCEYSHDKKDFDKLKKKGDGKKGKGKGGSRSASPSGSDKRKEPCWAWAKGNCKWGDKCKRQHDPSLFNIATGQKGNPKPKATPALTHA